MKEDLSQDLGDFDAPTLKELAKLDLSGSYNFYGDQISDFKSANNTLISTIGISGAEVSESGGTITISHPDLGSVSFYVEDGSITGREVRAITDEMMTAVRKMYDAAVEGKPLGGADSNENNDPLNLGI